MNININNMNLFSQNALLCKLFSMGNGASGQKGVPAGSYGVQHRNSSYYYNEDGVPFFSKEQADRCINGEDCVRIR